MNFGMYRPVGMQMWVCGGREVRERDEWVPVAQSPRAGRAARRIINITLSDMSARRSIVTRNGNVNT